MSTQIEPREVLTYLNELGYQNISAQQLKEFIKDLKKLIKYDLGQKTKENVDPQKSKHEPDVFTSLYETRTEASKAKVVAKKDKVISVQIKRPMMPTSCKYTDDRNVNFEESVKTHSTIGSTNMASETSTDSNRGDGGNTVASSTRQRPKTSSSKNRVSVTEPSLKPRSSFIRPRINIKPCKSDPVTLYHQYQAEWKRQKIPGEDNHSTLRWAIRERMLGDPSILPSVPLKISHRV